MEILSWLKQLSSEQAFFRHKQVPSLDPTKKILKALGNPDKDFEYRVIVGGTAGKGTIAYRTAHTLQQEGKSVVCLTSPELFDVRERVCMNGQIVSEEDFKEALEEVRTAAESINESLTYYEAVVLAGIIVGAKSECEILVAEIGLGGEFDAVNAVSGKRISVLTFVGEDHLDIFGSLENAAETKSKIFTSDSILNLSYEKRFQDILLKNAASGVVEFIKGVPSNYNAKIIKRVVRKILGHSDFILENIQIPGRWESFKVGDNVVILDGAHSKPRFEYIEPKIQKLTGKKVCVFAMTKNHDPESFRIVSDLFDTVIITTLDSEIREFFSTEALSKYYPQAVIEEDYQRAFDRALELGDKIVVTGSLFLCGVIRNVFDPPEKIIEQ